MTSLQQTSKDRKKIFELNWAGFFFKAGTGVWTVVDKKWLVD
jgi:hypothetical protein